MVKVDAFSRVSPPPIDTIFDPVSIQFLLRQKQLSHPQLILECHDLVEVLHHGSRGLEPFHLAVIVVDLLTRFTYFRNLSSIVGALTFNPESDLS